MVLEGEGGWWRLPSEKRTSSLRAVGGLACRPSAGSAVLLKLQVVTNTAAKPTETEPKRIVEKSKLKVDWRSILELARVLGGGERARAPGKQRGGKDLERIKDYMGRILHPAATRCARMSPSPQNPG